SSNRTAQVFHVRTIFERVKARGWCVWSVGGKGKWVPGSKNPQDSWPRTSCGCTLGATWALPTLTPAPRYPLAEFSTHTSDTQTARRIPIALLTPDGQGVTIPVKV